MCRLPFDVRCNPDAANSDALLIVQKHHGFCRARKSGPRAVGGGAQPKGDALGVQHGEREEKQFHCNYSNTRLRLLASEIPLVML